MALASSETPGCFSRGFFGSGAFLVRHTLDISNLL
jgi:hypothetical protein